MGVSAHGTRRANAMPPKAKLTPATPRAIWYSRPRTTDHPRKRNTRMCGLLSTVRTTVGYGAKSRSSLTRSSGHFFRAASHRRRSEVMSVAS